MNIVLDRPTVSLSIVNNATPQTAERVQVPTLAKRVKDVLFYIKADIEDWEAIAHVAKLEEFLGRECGADEIEDQVALVIMVKRQHEQLSKVLAGRGYLMEIGDIEYVDRDDDWSERLRERYEANVAKMRARRAEYAA